MVSRPPSAPAIPRMREAMTPFPYAIDAGHSVGDAQRMMQHRSIRHLPVTKDGEVYSVLDERELSLALARPDTNPWALQVRDVCAKDPFIADVADRLDAVLGEMAERRLDCVVVAEDDRVAGIFTSVDAYRLFMHWLRKGTGEE